MSIERDNEAIVGRWFTSFRGETCNLSIVVQTVVGRQAVREPMHQNDRRFLSRAFRKRGADVDPDVRNSRGSPSFAPEGVDAPSQAAVSRRSRRPR